MTIDWWIDCFDILIQSKTPDHTVADHANPPHYEIPLNRQQCEPKHANARCSVSVAFPCKGNLYSTTCSGDDPRNSLIKKTSPAQTTSIDLASAFQTENLSSSKLKIRLDRSAMLLASIVVLFILTHSYRIALKTYEITAPNSNTNEKFNACFIQFRR